MWANAQRDGRPAEYRWRRNNSALYYNSAASNIDSRRPPVCIIKVLHLYFINSDTYHCRNLSDCPTFHCLSILPNFTKIHSQQCWSNPAEIQRCATYNYVASRGQFR